MTPIDLIPYADYSQKIPENILAPVNDKLLSSTKKILTAHFIDFSVSFLLTSMMATIFHQSMRLFMVTSGLKNAFMHTSSNQLGMTLLPIILFSYYFLSYFMNHGQTWGMYFVKRRIDMKSQDIADSFRWATHSFLMSFTGGLFFAFKKDVWDCFKPQDHLYTELISYKDFSPVCLVSMADKNNLIPKTQDWGQAA